MRRSEIQKVLNDYHRSLAPPDKIVQREDSFMETLRYLQELAKGEQSDNDN